MSQESVDRNQREQTGLPATCCAELRWSEDRKLWRAAWTHLILLVCSVGLVFAFEAYSEDWPMA